KKHTPGKGVEYFIYDARNRLALSSDKNSRQSNKWYYRKYDLLNRVVETGYIITTATFETLSAYYDINTNVYPGQIFCQENFYFDTLTSSLQYISAVGFVADSLAMADEITSKTKGL